MPTLTRSQAHIVVAISGKPAYLRGADGKLHLLKVGDLVNNGEQILTTQGGIVELRDRIDPAVAKQADETDAVIEALNRDDADAATAAGNAGGDGGGFQPGLRVDRISESTTSASLLTTGIDRSSTNVTERATAPELQLSAATPPVVTPPVNAAPVAIAASASGAEDTTLPISLTGQDPDGSVVSITVTGLPANGVLLLGDGVTPVAVGQSLTPAQAAALLFRPDADLNGNTQIGFTVTDNQGAVSSPAQVQIAVTAVNDAPVAAPNTGITAEDTPVSGNVLDNDSDVDSATLTVTQFTVGGTTFAAGIPAGLPGVGTLVIQSDGSFTFTPAPNFNGTVPVASYVVSDGSLSASSTLSLSVSPVNDPPVAADDNVTTDEDTPVTLGVSALLGNDSDADGNPLTLVSVQAPVNGTVALVGGNVVFTPAPDYNGPASFSYTITDGQGGTSTATVVVDVKPVIDPAISISDVTVNEAAGTATFTVTLDQATTATVSVGYGSADGSATAGADFGAVSGTLTFAPGVTSQTITVPITNDAVFEGGETFNIKLTAPVNATLADDTGIGTIRDDGTGSGGSDNDTPVISVSAGNALEGTSAVFTVSLSNASTSPVVFTPSLASGSAVVGTDTAAASALEVSTDGGASWSVVSGNVTIAAGSTSVQLRLPTTDDTLAETSETFSLTATPVSGAVAAAASANATIIDNDGPPSLFIDDVTVNEAAGTVSFTVSLSTASGLPVSVSYGSADGSAVAGSDYTAALGTLTFAPGVTSQTVTVAITNDTVFEASETFNINLSSPVNATIADGTGVGTIVDNDAAPTITTVSSPTVVEGTDLVYSVALSNASSTASTFAYSLGGGSAAAADYGSPTFSNGVTLAAGVLTVPAGVTSFTVTLPTTQDTLNETSETVPLSIDGVAGTGTITDNDPTPSLSINDVSVNEAAGTATFTVTLSAASGQAVSVGYASANGSATAASDYTAVAGTLTFAPGVTSQTVTVSIGDDTVFEGNEVFNINLSAPINATIADGTGVGTIVDNDAAPTITTVSSPTVVEGTDLVYSVALSNASSTASTFAYSLGGGSAAAADYGSPTFSNGVTLAAGVLTVPAGVTSFTVTLPTTQDTLNETSETVPLSVGGVAATGTITDNDPTPSLSINDVSVNEAAGTATFTVTLSAASGQSVSVGYASADGSAVAGSDYAAAVGTLTFAPGVTSQTVTVAITNDTVFEASETFNINLSSPVNATIADGTGVGTIVDNDAAPTIATVSSPTVVEGTDLVYSIALSNASSTATTFAYSLGGGSAAAADYGSPTFSNGVTLAAGVLTVPAGVTSFTVTLPTTQDTLNETSETVPLSVGGVAGTGTITDNDPTPSLTINDVSVNEAAGTATFTVTLSAASGQAVSVGYASANGSATAASDYTAAAGTLTFAPGVTSQTVTVAITNDTVFEASETFNINLSSPVNATIADGTGVGTIVDNDAAPTITTVSSPTVVEGTDLVYSVALSNASSSASTFAYSLGGGSAGATDYGSPTFSNGVTLAAGVLTVPAGVTSFTVTLPTTQDTLNETSETVPLSVGGVAATGTITDNDPTPSLSINDVSVNEAAGTATFTVTLSTASGQSVSVGYSSANGSAIAGSDYTAVSGTLSFAPGVTSQTITVPITNDLLAEASEAFSINLGSPTNATIADGLGVATITDNDFAPALDLDANNSSTATGANYITSYTENAVGVAIADADVSLTDTDSATLAGATVTLANAQTGDVLAVGTLPAGINAVVAGNVVTLTGTASLAAYQTALRAITFANTTDTPNTTPRSITVVVTDGFNSSNVATTTVNVIAVNDAPAGIDRAVSTGEDIPYRFSAADFRMNDAEEGANVAPSAVRIDTLPTNGTLTLNGTTVTAGQVLTPTDVGNLSFTPAANANGANYANFAFSVRDSSGAFDPSPNTLTISVSARVDLSVQDVQHWTFNEGSGTTTANNYASAAQTGTRTDGITAGDSDLRPTFTANGHEGAAMQFNGVYTGVRDGGYVALPTAVTDPLRGGAAGGGSASLAFWIKTTQTGGTIGWDSPSVIGMENNGGTSDVQWGWINSAGRIGFGLANEAGVLSTNPINNNQWHQVTINHNFTTGATEVWVDGTLNSSGIVSPGAVMPNHFLGFGVTNDDGLASDRYLNGTLDDIRIYDRTLTASQIQAIYAVESNNLGANAVLDNDGGAVRFNIAANDHASVLISGAPIGSSLTDGTNTVAITADGQSVDVSGWNHSLLSVTGMGTNSAMLSVTATGATAGDSVTQYINIVTGSTAFNGTAGNDTQNGTSGSDFIGGGAGNDTITAGDGHDRIFGGANNDTINAGNGNDVIVGGAGNDTMTGGAGADVFQWQLADRGIAGTPAADVISDFDPASRAAGGDVLDLRDLLVGENRVGGTGNLDQYLDFDTTSTPGSTIIRISSSGSFAGGTYAAGQEDERITLTGVDLRSIFGLGAGSTDAQVIQELLNRNKLITDGP